MMTTTKPWIGVALAALLLAGCAGSPLRSYDDELTGTVQLVSSGQLDAAESQLDNNNLTGKDILYYLEKGELLSLKNDYAASRDAWLEADATVREWEDAYRADPAKVMGDIGAFLISDRVRRYDGQDHEKVFLSTKLAMDHILLGNFDGARVEMKKTYEREKLIERFREQEYEQLQEEAEKNDTEAKVADLEANGYPMEALDAPEVNALKNGFQNAFAHYLTGYFFEVTGEYSLAEPGYRNALILRPNSRLIRESLQRMGKRRPRANETDVLFVVESGFAPAWSSVTIPLPIRFHQRWALTPLSFPVVKSMGKSFMPSRLTANGKTIPVETIVDVEAMSKRLLKDQLPGIMMRTAIRAAAKSALQYAAQKQGGTTGAVAGALTAVFSVVTEQADERAWRTLPQYLAVGRAILPQGKVSVSFDMGGGRVHRADITVGKRVTVIPIRLTGDAVYVGAADVAAWADQFADAPPAVEEKTDRPARRRRSR